MYKKGYYSAYRRSARALYITWLIQEHIDIVYHIQTSQHVYTYLPNFDSILSSAGMLCRYQPLTTPNVYKASLRPHPLRPPTECKTTLLGTQSAIYMWSVDADSATAIEYKLIIHTYVYTEPTGLYTAALATQDFRIRWPSEGRLHLIRSTGVHKKRSCSHLPPLPPLPPLSLMHSNSKTAHKIQSSH